MSMKKIQVILSAAAMLLLFSACGNTEDHVHAYGEWAVTEGAFCTEDGVRSRVCSCGDVQTETIPAAGHTEGEWTVVSGENCEDGIERRQICSVCSQVVKTEIVTEHIYSKQTVSPTETENGYTLYTCTVCSASYQEDVVPSLSSQRALLYRLNDDGTCTVTGISASDAIALTIPSEIEGHTVTEIALGAFEGAPLTAIRLPDTLKKIGVSAFNSCKELTSIHLPESLTYIGTGAFTNCVALTEITIPASVTSIGTGAFEDCLSLSAVYYYSSCVPQGEIFDHISPVKTLVCGGTVVPAFRNLRYLETVEILDSVKIIADNAFRSKVALKTVRMGSGVTEIGNYAFSECHNLRELTLPDGLKTIGAGAFENTSLGTDDFDEPSLWVMKIPDTVTEIGAGAFARSKVRTVILPSGLTQIADDLFSCSALEYIIIPDSVTKIGKRAFYNTLLVRLTLPASLTFIDEAAFNAAGNPSVYLTDIEAWRNVELVSLYSNPLNGSDLYQNGELVTELTFPDGTTEIDFAFSGCKSITSVIVPDGVTVIGTCAFRNCTGLTSISIPDSVTLIKEAAFFGCTSLESLTIPNSVIAIEGHVFRECSALTKIVYGGTMEEWNAMQKASDWDYSLDAYTIRCVDGDITK